MENDKSIKSVLINEQAFKLYQSKKITIQEALMLSLIASLDNEQGCFATNKYFADNLPIEVDRVKEIIRSLVKKGYIKSKMVNNNTKRILRVVGEEKKVAEPEPARVEEIPVQGPVKEEKKVVPFNGNKNNTYKPKAKKDKFYGGYSHGFNYSQLEQLETQYVEKQLDEMHHDNLSDRAKELLAQVHIEEEPSEWLSVNQLKI